MFSLDIDKDIDIDDIDIDDIDIDIDIIPWVSTNTSNHNPTQQDSFYPSPFRISKFFLYQ